MSPTHLYFPHLGHTKVRLETFCISRRERPSGNFSFLFSPLWYLKCVIRRPLLPSYAGESFLSAPLLNSFPNAVHTEGGYVWSLENAEGRISCHQGLSLYWWRQIRLLTITQLCNKYCTDGNQGMPGDKGQGHGPLLGREPGKAQLPERVTFQWTIGGEGFVFLFISSINCYYYHYFIFIYFWNSNTFTVWQFSKVWEDYRSAIQQKHVI